MSLEAAIAENTAALKLLTEAIHAGRAAAAAKQAAPAPAGGAALPPKAAAEAAQREKPPAPPAAAGAAAITYDQVKTAVNALAKAKGRDAVIAALAKFGLAKATDAKPEQWPDLLAELNAQAVAA